MLFIAQNELLTACQSIMERLHLSYKEMVLALGVVEGRLAQMGYTQGEYDFLLKEETSKTQKAE